MIKETLKIKTDFPILKSNQNECLQAESNADDDKQSNTATLTPLSPTTCQLAEGESYEDLQYANLAIIQHKQGYRFTSDAVLLANSVRGATRRDVIELCGGSGVISILLAAKQQPNRIDVCEIQPRLAELAAKSILHCNLQSIIKVYCTDVRGIAKRIRHKYHIVVCNPPYRKVASGVPPCNNEAAIAKQELMLTLQQVISESASLLLDKGCLYLVHQTERFAELCTLCSNASMPVKEVTFVRPAAQKVPNLVIVRAQKGAKEGLVIHQDIIMFDEKGNYTPTVKALYSQE